MSNNYYVWHAYFLQRTKRWRKKRARINELAGSHRTRTKTHELVSCFTWIHSSESGDIKWWSRFFSSFSHRFWMHTFHEYFINMSTFSIPNLSNFEYFSSFFFLNFKDFTVFLKKINENALLLFVCLFIRFCCFFVKMDMIFV